MAKLVRVRVFPDARKETLTIDGGVLIVSVQEPPQDGRATARVRTLLARHFAVTEQSVRLKTGAQSRTKTFEIAD